MERKEGGILEAVGTVEVVEEEKLMEEICIEGRNGWKEEERDDGREEGWREGGMDRIKKKSKKEETNGMRMKEMTEWRKDRGREEGSEGGRELRRKLRRKAPGEGRGIKQPPPPISPHEKRSEKPYQCHLDSHPFGRHSTAPAAAQSLSPSPEPDITLSLYPAPA